MVKRMRYEYIWMPMFTQFMRASMSPKRDARRKIRAALWQEWTRPQFDGGGTSAEPFGEPSPLGLMSHRDRYGTSCGGQALSWLRHSRKGCLGQRTLGLRSRCCKQQSR